MAGVNNRLLAISWATLPMSAPRAMQVSRLLAHVADIGWQCDVVTSARSVAPDDATAELRIARFYEGRYRKHVVAERPAAQKSAAVPPDPWVEGAVALAQALLAQERRDVLATFAQPWTDHLVGLRLKQANPALPWMAHFSDPWVDSPYVDRSSEAALKAMAEQERAVVLAADALVFVTQEAADLVMRKYDSQLLHKVHVLPHCLDLAAMPTPTAARTQNGAKRRLSIVHTGSLYEGRRPARALLQALAQMKRRDANLPLSIQLVGHNPGEMEQEIVADRLQEIVSASPPCSWSKSLAIAAGADVLMVIDRPAEMNVFLPSKVIEYLALNKPILALTPDFGATAGVMRDLGYETAPPDQPAKIAAALQRLIDAWRVGRPALSPRQADVVERYQASVIAGRFAELLDRTVETTREIGALGLAAPWSPGESRAESDGKPGDTASPADAPAYSALQSILRLPAGRDSAIVYALIQRVPTAELELILSHPRVASIMINWSDERIETLYPDRVGSFRLGSTNWTLPNKLATTLAILGYADSLGLRRVVDALKHGVRQVVVQSPYAAFWETESTISLLGRAMLRRLRWSWSQARIGKPGLSATRQEESLARRLRETLKEARASTVGGDRCVEGRVVMVSASLDAGGAERQVVNSATGLVRRGYDDVTILCSNLSGPSLEFFRPQAEEQGVKVAAIARFVHAELDDALAQHRKRLPRILRHLPPEVAREVLPLVAELLLRRPQVVHAWQDYINVIAGIAAVIAGVPRIVLGGRSVAPYNFVFHQPYMRGAYQALAEIPNVVLTNNSDAGALDYAEWLDIPRQRFRIVQNGYDFTAMRRRPSDEIARFRRRMDIEPEATVVGTIMRFSEEKRPLLWVEAMATVAARRPDLRFLMIGSGVMREEAMRLARALGVDRRIVMPGLEKDAILALSSMDLFVLTSRKEGLPNTLIEAQAVGVPVIAIKAGGAGEAFDPGVTGRVVDEGTADAVAREVLAVLEDKAWYARAAERAPAYVREAFSLEQLSLNTLDLYELAPRDERSLQRAGAER